jgi:phytoene dehydrogenase-like protein
VILRRVASRIGLGGDGRATAVTHTAKDGGDPQTVGCACVVSNAAPAVLGPMLPAGAAVLEPADARRPPSISLFTLALGLAEPPRTFGVSSYSTQLLPGGMARLADYAAGTRLMAQEPDRHMPPLAIADYDAIDSGVPAPPYVLSVIGPDHVSNWQHLDAESYREKRSRWQTALIAHLDRHFPGLAAAVRSSSFNTALSVQQYLNAPHGAVYGFAPSTGCGTPRTSISNLYLASAYAGRGGYTGVIAAAGACAGLILEGA